MNQLLKMKGMYSLFDKKKEAYCLLIGFFCISVQFSFSQNQKIADSLKIIYEIGTIEGVEELELLRNLAFNEVTDLSLALTYADKLVTLAQQESNFLYVYRGYSQKGQTYRLSGDYIKSIDAFFKCSEAAMKLDDKKFEGGSYLYIADVYSEIGNSDNAQIYYAKSIDLLRKTKDSLTLATAFLNAGDEAFNTKNYNLALAYFGESGQIFNDIDYPIGKAYNLGNIGMVYAEQGKDDLAKTNINEAISILEGFEDYYAISEYLTYMSDIYSKQDKVDLAVSYAENSLELAQKQGLKKQLSETNFQLYELHEQMRNYEKSLSYHKTHIVYRDSLINIENIETMADMRTENLVSQKQVQVDLLNQQKRNQLIILGFTGVLLLTLFWYYRSISKEKKRSERLLLNILPEETALELKQYGKVKAKKFDSVTVLFTDFKGFTHYAESLSPEELVESVDFYFSKFDHIIETHGLEKIKTIGDAYMCAGGLHGANNDHAHKMLLAAFDIADFVKESKEQNNKNNARFDIRIGVNTGPVVAGIVGTHKFAYDIWGDAVNVASRMESNSEPGKINISQDTYAIIKDDFKCEYRGEIEVKNRGEMKMYFVNKKTV